MENKSKWEIRRINQYNIIKETLLNNGVILLTTEDEYKNTEQQIYICNVNVEIYFIQWLVVIKRLSNVLTVE